MTFREALLAAEIDEAVIDDEARLMKPSGYHCPECAEPMTQGEYEAAGLCSDCYFDVVEDY